MKKPILSLSDFTKDMFSLTNQFRFSLGKKKDSRPMITKDLVVLLNSVCGEWKIVNKEWDDNNTVPSAYIIETIGASVEDIYKGITRPDKCKFPMTGIPLIISDIGKSTSVAKIFGIWWDRKEKFFRVG